MLLYVYRQSKNCAKFTRFGIRYLNIHLTKYGTHATYIKVGFQTYVVALTANYRTIFTYFLKFYAVAQSTKQKHNPEVKK